MSNKHKNKNNYSNTNSISPVVKQEATISIQELKNEFSNGGGGLLEIPLQEKINKLDKLERQLLEDKVKYEAEKKDFEDRRKQYDDTISDIENNQALLSKLEKKLFEWEAKLKKEQNIIDENQKTLEVKQIVLSKSMEEQERNKKEILKLKSEMDEKTVALKERELNAELGFLNERKVIIDSFIKEADKNKDLLSQSYRDIFETINKSYGDVSEAMSTVQLSWSDKLSKFIDEQSKYENRLLEKEKNIIRELEKRKEEIIKQQALLKAEKEVYEEDKIIYTSDLNAKYESKILSMTETIKLYKKRNTELETLLNRYEGMKYEIELQEKRDMDARIENYHNKIDTLEQELALRLPIEYEDELKRLRKSKKDSDEEILKLKSRLGLLEDQRSKNNIEQIQLESLKQEKEVLEKTSMSLKISIQQLSEELDRLTKSKEIAQIFPTCSNHDIEYNTHEYKARNDYKITLKELVEVLRYKLYDAHKEKGITLNYSKEDLRSFLAGMAMSKLIILEGISGTGKSSLPMEISKIIGGECGKIEVQSGWRDRNDLLGYYNSFEKKYYENSFLSYLYKAQTERYKDVPFIILLDEMNLSHPEYYFADILSEIEKNNTKERRIRLLPKDESFRKIPQILQRNMDNDGYWIPIPENVWFVGTANNDETTMGVADKVYDRAHILELPEKHPNDSPVNPNTFIKELTIPHLNNLFSEANRKHDTVSKDVRKLFREELQMVARDKFEISWGNRLDIKISNYVPIILEAGGSIEEAVDFLVASKVLHKIINRRDVPQNKIEGFQKDFDDICSMKNYNYSKFTKTRECLAKLLK